MKSLMIAVYSVCLASSLIVARADESKDGTQSPSTPSSSASSTVQGAKARKRPALTEEQKTARKELLAKYDKNKDGKIDKDERKAVTSEDKAKLRKAGLQARVRKPAKKD
jgi:hypothetical protein